MNRAAEVRVAWLEGRRTKAWGWYHARGWEKRRELDKRWKGLGRRWSGPSCSCGLQGHQEQQFNGTVHAMEQQLDVKGYRLTVQYGHFSGLIHGAQE